MRWGEAWARPALAHRVVERGEGEPDVARGAEAPADDTTGVTIHDDGQVAPGPGDLQVRDVADPHLIASGGDTIELTVGDARKEPVQPRNAPIERHGPGA